MADKRFNVVFSGKLVEGAKPLEVLSKLAQLLELDEQQVRQRFKGGAGSVILNDLDGNEAYLMRDRLREAGAY